MGTVSMMPQGSCALLTLRLPRLPDQHKPEDEKPLKRILFQRFGLVAGAG
jgi:hypothetical protein